MGNKSQLNLYIGQILPKIGGYISIGGLVGGVKFPQINITPCFMHASARKGTCISVINYGFNRTPKTIVSGCSKGALEGTLWSEYVITTNFHGGKTNDCPPQKIKYAVKFMKNY